MHIVYVDESGDSGSRTVGGSMTYTLAAVLVPASRWPEVFDALVKFRRHVRDSYRLPMRAEVKANWLIRGAGDLRGLRLNESERRAIFDLHMKFLHWNALPTFAVVIEKPAARPPIRDVREHAWDTLLQRLAIFSRKGGGPLVLVHDEGEDKLIRAHARRRRRYGTAGSIFGGSVRNDLTSLVDDPWPKRSSDSYFIQLADLAAYAAYRSCHPPGPRRLNIADARTWAKIGDARLFAAAGLRPRHHDTAIVRRDDV